MELRGLDSANDANDIQQQCVGRGTSKTMMQYRTDPPTVMQVVAGYLRGGYKGHT